MKEIAAGQIFGRWTVVEAAPSQKRQPKGWRRFWLCKCACGASRPVAEESLLKGKSQSCGCLHSDIVRERENPNTAHRLYPVWRGMMDRCYREANAAFHRYGGRGIRVDERWHDLDAFLRDVAPTFEEGLTLDRRDNDGPYSPENWRWATDREQQRNRRVTTSITWNGRTLPLVVWAEELKLPLQALRSRIKRGWTAERALTTPCRQS